MEPSPAVPARSASATPLSTSRENPEAQGFPLPGFSQKKSDLKKKKKKQKRSQVIYAEGGLLGIPQIHPSEWRWLSLASEEFVIFFNKSQPSRRKEGFCAPPMSPFPPPSVCQCAEPGSFPSCLCLHAFGLGAVLPWPVFDMFEYPVLGRLFI